MAHRLDYGCEEVSSFMNDLLNSHGPLDKITGDVIEGFAIGHSQLCPRCIKYRLAQHRGEVSA